MQPWCPDSLLYWFWNQNLWRYDPGMVYFKRFHKVFLYAVKIENNCFPPPPWDRVSLSRLECSGAISAHWNLCLLGWSNFPASGSRVAGITRTHHHAQITFVFLVETVFHHVGQDGLDLLTSWSTCLGLPKCWDYRREPPRPAFICFQTSFYGPFFLLPRPIFPHRFFFHSTSSLLLN